jgi:uncharacterized protein YcfL
MFKYLFLLIVMCLFLIGCSSDRTIAILCDKIGPIDGQLVDESSTSYVVIVKNRAKFYFPKNSCIMVEELNND